jgi:hypothetical protein
VSVFVAGFKALHYKNARLEVRRTGIEATTKMATNLHSLARNNATSGDF